MDSVVEVGEVDAVPGVVVEHHAEMNDHAEPRGEQCSPPRLEYVLDSYQGKSLPRTVQNPPPSVQPGLRRVRSKIS